MISFPDARRPGRDAQTRPDQTVFAKEKVGVVARRPAASWLLVSSKQKESEVKNKKKPDSLSLAFSDALSGPRRRGLAAVLANALQATLRFWYFLRFNEAFGSARRRVCQERLRGFEMVTLFGATRARDLCASNTRPPTTQKMLLFVLLF